MTTYGFMVAAKKAVWNWYASQNRERPESWKDVYVVWQCKALQNHKAILSTPMHDKLIFECTLNGAKSEMYLDVYSKIDNQKIVVDENYGGGEK